MRFPSKREAALALGQKVAAKTLLILGEKLSLRSTKPASGGCFVTMMNQVMSPVEWLPFRRSETTSKLLDGLN